jgi:hypothetical protein
MHASYRRRNRIAGQFSARTVEMLESPAYRALTRAAHQALARIEIEHAHHGGQDNGKLPVTFDQFVEYGLHRHAIAPAIRELIALGFVEVTEAGRAGNAEWRRPNRFRLTYRQANRAAPTDEWRRISEDDAVMIAKGARRPGSNSAGVYRKRQKQTDPENVSPVTVSAKSQCAFRHRKPESHSTETVTTGDSAETITGGGGGRGGCLVLKVQR